MARRFAFVFPMASGHMNPSLPLARRLVSLGHQVHYISREQMREAIEDTGATFHSDMEEMPELYEGRTPDLFAALNDLRIEFGLEDDPYMIAFTKLKEICLEMMMPGLLRWLARIRAEAVVCCPLMNREASLGAQVLRLPCVCLLTTAGPGAMPVAMADMLKTFNITLEQCMEERANFQPLLDSLQRLREKYGVKVELTDDMWPMGLSAASCESKLTLVTTAEFLSDPLPQDLQKLYDAAGCTFAYVGPLLDKAGAKRAAGHKFELSDGRAEAAEPAADVVAMLRAAKAQGRRVVYASMGTVITGDSPEMGWHDRIKKDGVPQGLTGKELCQAAWKGLFDALGTEGGPLLLVALGPQSDALEDLEVPANAFCLPVMPQVDLLKSGVDLFLTHGGQNSFMEALSSGTPLVVCPGFADQPINAQKAVDLGVGLQVPRPECRMEDASREAAKYQAATAAAVAAVLAELSFLQKARGLEEELKSAGGVAKAVDLILSTLDHPHKLGGA
ncbi:unnamed protein product [Effrenium voratum]|uniref:Glycosyltransferase n=1 Tax=Effrenium voratum TaxID=2562239 RepID=A0AA36IL70_9DINO|nr:unnamed protein product [Effrenium voratum]